MLAIGTNYNDGAGTITAGGTAQEIFNPNSERKGVFFYNESDTNMRVSFGGDTASASKGFLVVPNYYWEPPAVPQGRMTVYCATTGKAFSAGEFY